MTTKTYPMWESIVAGKEQFIGGILTDQDDNMSTEIVDIEIVRDESYDMFMVRGKDFDCSANLQYHGITAVLQEWIEYIPIRMQSTLLLSLRGPDGTRYSPAIKEVTRWLRSLVFKPGNPENVQEFMNPLDPPAILEKTNVARELEFMPVHYYSHLMHGLEVVGYCHPDDKIRTTAHTRYVEMCHLMHLPVETLDDFHERLKMLEFPGGVQPKDGFEAYAIMNPPKPKKQKEAEGRAVDRY